MFSRISTGGSIGSFSDNVQRLRDALDSAECVVVGAGAGLSTAAGYTYSGERFMRYFSDFAEKYGFSDMYSGGFYPFRTEEEYWAYWSRYVFVNRYAPKPNPLYLRLKELLCGKDYFVLTTNVDHCFQKAGFDKKRLFYTQGDYGLFQCSKPCCDKTYDNEKQIMQMVLQQENMKIPQKLIPICPECGAAMTMNLRCDDKFVQDRGWYAAAERYASFTDRCKDRKTLYLELGVGMNTPGIIKYPFWLAAAEQKDSVYACINDGKAVCPEEIKSRSICINADIKSVVEAL